MFENSGLQGKNICSWRKLELKKKDEKNKMIEFERWDNLRVAAFICQKLSEI